MMHKPVKETHLQEPIVTWTVIPSYTVEKKFHHFQTNYKFGAKILMKTI